MKNVESVLVELRAAGHRVTAARQGILEILTAVRTPLSVKEIHVKLTAHGPVDKVTVYREIEFLTKESLITEVRFQDRSKRYELASLDHHHHLICQRCDRVEDIEMNEDFEKEAQAVARRRRFTVLRHSLEFFGLCHSCVKA